MLRLGVNIDHVATVRQARRVPEPDPVQAAVLAELGGADGITVHLRADRRHIQDRDVEILRQVVKTRLNLEMAATQEMLRVALTVKPDQVTLVPERREELTTEGGLDVVLNSVQLSRSSRRWRRAASRSACSWTPTWSRSRRAHKLDAKAVEINTAAYSEARDERTREAALRKVTDAARLGRKLGLAVHAGHGLTYQNVGAIAALTEITELNIGHNIVARAMLVGMERAVSEMVQAMRRRETVSYPCSRPAPWRTVSQPMIEAHGQTDVGRRRKLNEDNFLVDDEVGLYAVCDGMGGHNAGEVASKMAIETMAAFIKKSAGEEKDITWPYGLETDLSFEGNRLKTAIRLANKRVFKAADNREDYTGMGTTAVAALVADGVLTIGLGRRQPLLPGARREAHPGHARRLLGLRRLGGGHPHRGGDRAPSR